jgi:diguanylate cyclase (GGDEF)-like protein
VLVASVAYALARAVVRPLNRLTRAAERVADGDLSGHLPVTQKDEIGRLTRVFNRMTEQLRRGQAELEAANEALREQNHLLEALSVTDALTGLYNRNKLETVLEDQYARFRRNRRPFCVLMLDIDNFKSINDTYGHAAGDEVLVNLAKVLVQSVRGIDSVARYGGEEFVVVLIETDAEAALDVAERVRLLVQTPRYGEATGQLVSVPASIGVACCRAEDTGPADVLARADQALYEAKDAGRNRVQRAS